MSALARERLAYLVSHIIDGGLCTRCGTCVGICPAEKIQFTAPLAECLPRVDDEKDCGECDGLCLTVCPGEGVDFAAMNRQVFGELPEDLRLGASRSWHVAWASDPKIRAAGASGGAITALAGYLLDTGVVEGVACLIDDPAQPLLPRPIILRDRATLHFSQQSKYSVAPLNTVLRDIAVFDGTVAIVALPDQVHALRKLEALGHPVMKKITVILGSYCGAVQHFTAVASFLRKHGIRQLDAVSKVEYRAGAWPGKLRVTLRDGRTLELDKFYANYMTLLYSMERSLLCVDLSNELADISFGDAWATRYEARTEGFSLVAARTARGEALFRGAIEAGAIRSEASRWEDAMAMHGHGIYNKKIAVWSRIQLRRSMGLPAPDYGYEVVRTPRQQAVGFAIALVFWMGRTRPVRAAVQLLPLGWTGRVFQGVRKRWRSATQAGHTARTGDFAVRWRNDGGHER